MTQLTNTGFERTRLIDRLAEIQGRARAIFGQDIDLSSDTMDGQHIGLFAEAIADLDELAEMVWLSFDPDLAVGTSLSRLVKLNGIERSQGAYSTVELTLTGTPQTLVPVGSIVSNDTGTVTVYTQMNARLNESGIAMVTAATDTMGAINAGTDSLNVIKTPLFGWSSVTNAAPMVIGKVRETDQQLRLRRRGSVSKGNRNMTEALWAALSDLPGVVEVAVLENATPNTDSRGLPPHSIHAVVLGGLDTDIAQTIWINKTGGTVLAGQKTVAITDQIGGTQYINFSRPTSVTIRIKVLITPKVGWTYNTSNIIKKTLVEWINSNVQVGEELVNSALYSPLNEIGGFAISKIELAKGDDVFAEQSLTMRFYERVSIDVADIEVVQS